ncbi:MAG: translocation/assembly module TamB domain-containing protein [Kofleriaceae bacterium]
MNRRVKRVLRWVLRGVLALVALVVILVAFLHTPWGKAFVRWRIEAKLAAAVDGSVSLGAVDYGWWFGHVELDHLAFASRDGKPVLAIASVRLALDPMSLVRGAPVIEDLDVAGLSATIVETARGRTNLTGLFKPTGARPPTSVRIAKLHVAGGATFTRSDGAAFTLADLAIEGSLAARPGDEALDLALGRLTATVVVAVPNTVTKRLAVSIGPITVARRGGTLDVSIAKLGFGALSVGAIDVRLGLAHGTLAGAQSITLSHARLDHARLQTMLGRAVFADDVTFDASLAGPPDKLVAQGAVATGKATLTLQGTLDVSDLARPRYDVALEGQGTSADVMAAPPHGVPPIATDLHLTVAGSGLIPPDLDATVGLDLGPTRIGKLTVDRVTARAHAHAHGLTLDHLEAHGLGFAITASGDIDTETMLHATVTVAGTPPETIEVLRAAGIAVWHRIPPISQLAVTVHAAGKLDGKLELEVEPAKLRIAGGTVAIGGRATLVHRELTDAATKLEIRGLDLGALARLAHRPAPKLHGALSGTLSFERTPREEHARGDLAIALRAPAVTLEVRGAADLATAELHARVVRRADRAVLATVTARVAHHESILLPRRAWRVVVDAPSRSFAELAALLPPDVRVALPEGEVAVRAELGGTPARPRGSAELDVDVATPAGPQHVTLHAEIAPGPHGTLVTTRGAVTSAAAVGTGAAATPFATIAGTVTLPSAFVGARFAPRRVAAGLELSERIEVPERPLASVPLVPAAIAALGGTIGGQLELHGSPAELAFAGTFRWRDYPLAGGGRGATTLELAGTPVHVQATLSHGPLQVTADVTRAHERIAVRARVRSEPTALVPLLPESLVSGLAGVDPGTLRADLTAELGFVQRGHAIALDAATLTGSLSLRGGSVALPHTGRRWHDLELELAGDPRGLRIAKLAAHETDAQVRDRSLEISGLLAVATQRDASGALVLRPATGELDIALHDWLALGAGSPLFSDAPTASIDLAAHAVADLRPPIVAIDATVSKLDVRIPDRLERSHQPEQQNVSADIIFLDGHNRPGALPLPVETRAHPRAALDVRIHLPEPVHVLKAPLDLDARGDLTVTVRDTGVATRGTLVTTGGMLQLFGRDHRVVDGQLVFSDAHPHGEFTLHFAHALPPDALRELSRIEPARVAITGAPAKPVVTLGGATNVTLDEVMSMYHAGHPVFEAPPGLYPSSTAEVPRGDQELVFGYIASALPSFLFLDRIFAWADPSEPRGGYGRIRNLEAERFSADRSARVRVVGRPTTPGRSTAELQLDHLWLDRARVLFGAGLRAGDRLGGGLGLVFEWSSAD